MKHSIARFLFGLLVSLPLCAVAQVQQTRTNLYNEINANLPDNTSNQITPAFVRQVLNDITASSANALTDPFPISGAAVSVTYTGTPQTPIYLNVYPANITIPASSASGAQTYTQSAGFIASVMYEEGNATTGNTLTALTFNDLVNAGTICVRNCANLASLSFPALVTCHHFVSEPLAAITTLSVPNLVAITYGPLELNSNVSNQTGFNFGTFPILTTLSFPSLTMIQGSVGVGVMALCTTWNFPVLATVTGNFQPATFNTLTNFSCPDLAIVGGNFAPFTFALCTTWSFPALAYIGGSFTPNTFAALTDLECNALQTVAGPTFSVATMTNLATVSFAGMVSYGGVITMNSGLGKLANMTLGTVGTLKAVTGATITVSGQALTSASVNAILHLLVSLDGTGGTTLWGSGKTLNISGGTSAAPSGQGVTDKATLVGRGATVTTN